MPLNLDLITPELVFLGWRATSPDDVFTRLANELESRGYVAPTWRNAVSERERTYPTGLQTLACGIAIPHADAVHVQRPFIAIVRPEEPVRFAPMDGMGDPVDAELIIALGFTHEGDQVSTLQHLMSIFADEDRARALAGAADEAAVARLLRA
ncbi:hypothetical protein B5G20_07810 [Collinsella sp. An7]|uniref:PTS sugar transporter subunit IIA n=1 Tax=Collinsella sp. An7 TaxID=1965651 RepID=UPI000B395D5B|nr:PTS sugar transporter subunit IIA [Collinsella sp. An7]OUN46482.1 hypothetical protein B5G20_07810 [Collinsella sp. An7]